MSFTEFTKTWWSISLQLTFAVFIALSQTVFKTYFTPAPGQSPSKLLYVLSLCYIGLALLQAYDKIKSTREAKEAGRQIQEAERQLRFVRLYTDVVTESVDILVDHGDFRAADLQRFYVLVLQMVCGITNSYLNHKGEMTVNANLMKQGEIASFVDPESNRFYSQVYFFDPMREASSYSDVLVLSATAHEEASVPNTFALPVDSDADRLLIGAPKAFVTGQIQVVENTKDREHVNTLLHGQPPSVCESIHKYFENQSFESFVSIPLTDGKTTVGVLNIQADSPHIMGEDMVHKADLCRFLKPLCSVLTAIIFRERSNL